MVSCCLSGVCQECHNEHFQLLFHMFLMKITEVELQQSDLSHLTNACSFLQAFSLLNFEGEKSQKRQTDIAKSLILNSNDKAVLLFLSQHSAGILVDSE